MPNIINVNKLSILFFRKFKKKIILYYKIQNELILYYKNNFFKINILFFFLFCNIKICKFYFKTINNLKL